MQLECCVTWPLKMVSEYDSMMEMDLLYILTHTTQDNLSILVIAMKGVRNGRDARHVCEDVSMTNSNFIDLTAKSN